MLFDHDAHIWNYFESYFCVFFRRDCSTIPSFRRRFIRIRGPGSTYFNVASLCNRQWTGSSWVCSTSVANPVSGFGTTNFIPKYTTGASGVIGNSSCSDNGTTFNCADNMTQAGVQVETGTGATNTMSKFTNGPGGVQGNSQCTDNGTTVSCSDR